MRITKLSLHKLYGTLDKEVLLKDNLNLLVGINGSGKTSVLNIIDWLLGPNFPKLCTVPFQKLSLHFSYKETNYVLEATQTKALLALNLKQSEKTWNPITVKLLGDPASIDGDERESMMETYGRLGPEKSELALWNFLGTLPKPVVIALDRSISAEANSKVYLEFEQNAPTKRRFAKITPLDKVRQVTSLSYNNYRFQVALLNERLKARLVMSALKAPSSAGAKKRGSRIKADRDIDLLEKKVIGYLSTSLKDIDVTAIESFFKRAKIRPTEGIRFPLKSDADIQQAYLASMFFDNQYTQLEEMAQAFNEFEQGSAEAFDKLKRYLDTVNVFLMDSKKQIAFSEPNNVLCFYFLNPDGTRSQEPPVTLDHLSSGEKQILILFTFLSFVAEDNRIFIVDEPELSLHPKWQAEFTTAFLMLKPDSTQLLLATHSPEIVGDHKSDCVVLLP